METISLRLDSALAKQLEKDVKEFKYSTKTELVREALREKMSTLEEKRKKEKALAVLDKYYGAFKGKGKFESDEDFHKWRSEVFSKELEKEFEQKYGFKF